MRITILEALAVACLCGCNGTVTEGGDGCVPLSTSPCYNGPEGTQGVGTCKGGTKTCDARGTAYGPCVGEIVPKAEDCRTPDDEDCDGLTPACTGFWSKAGSVSDIAVPTSIAVDAQGNVIVIGVFRGSLTFGGPTLMSNWPEDIFLVKLDPSGTVLWTKAFGSGGDQLGSAVAVDATGNVFVTGAFEGTIDFGGGTLTSVSGAGGDLFLAKLDPNGNHLWSKSFGAVGNAWGSSVAVDAAGNILLAGEHAGTVSFGGVPLDGALEYFAAKFSAAGTHLWSKGFNHATGQIISIRADSFGNMLLVATCSETIDFGGGQLQGKPWSYDVCIAKLDASGVHQWSKRFGDDEAQSVHGVAVDSLGNLVITGDAWGTIDFGGGPINAINLSKGFVAKFDVLGNHVFSKGLDFGQSGTAGGVVATSANDVLLTGNFAGGVDFGGGPVIANNLDVYVAKLTPLGTQIWVQHYGANNVTGESWEIATDGAANPCIAGRYDGPLDLGSGPMPVPPQTVVAPFIAKLAP